MRCYQDEPQISVVNGCASQSPMHDYLVHDCRCYASLAQLAMLCLNVRLWNLERIRAGICWCSSALMMSIRYVSSSQKRGVLDHLTLRQASSFLIFWASNMAARRKSMSPGMQRWDSALALSCDIYMLYVNCVSKMHMQLVCNNNAHIYLAGLPPPMHFIVPYMPALMSAFTHMY